MKRMFRHPANTYLFYWATKPCELFREYRYEWEARKNGVTLGTGVSVVYCMNDTTFLDLVYAWNHMGHTRDPEKFHWLYRPLDDQLTVN
ncbi:MAG: hypothetical protein JSS66_05640 [Armatimonadetes bacterium]|nr:hypothetical protein [Armatimonadota bacterium]